MIQIDHSVTEYIAMSVYLFAFLTIMFFIGAVTSNRSLDGAGNTLLWAGRLFLITLGDLLLLAIALNFVKHY